MQTTTYKLNVTPGGVPLVIHVSQYDVGLRQYTFQPYTNVGSFSYVDGATVTLEATKPDGYAVVHECDYNQDGSITYTIQEQLAAKPGRVWSKVVIRDGEDVLGTGAVVWMVDYAGVKDDAIISDSDMAGIAAIEENFKRLVGTPIAVTTAAGMTDHGKIYLYEGSETGYTNGNWYYWNGSAWASGGAYGGSTVEVDATLSIAGMAADAKATGDAVNELKSDIDVIYDGDIEITDWILGSVTKQGADVATDQKIRPENMVSLQKHDVVAIKNGNMDRHANVMWTVDALGNLTNILDGAWNTSDETFTVSEDCLLLVVYSKNPLTTISTDNFTGTLTITRPSINSLTEKIDEVEKQDGHYVDVSDLQWEIGTFADTTGLDAESTTRIRTKNCIYLPKGSVISASGTNVVTHYWYENGVNYTVGQSWAQSITLSKNYYVRIVMRKGDNSTINTSDIPNVYASLSIFVPYDVEIEPPKQNTDVRLPFYGVNPLLFNTQLIAHRGNDAVAPENTMPAFKQAYADGLRIMEADVDFSSDNIPVLLHDTTIDRTSNGTGTCSSIPLATLKTYDFGSWFSPSYTGTRIPTLEEFVLFCKTRNCVLELDLAEKNFDLAHLQIIYNVIKKYGMLQSAIFTVYNTAAELLLSIDTDIILCIGGVTTQNQADTAVAGKVCNLLILSVPVASLTTTLVKYITNYGAKVRVWTITTASDAVDAFEEGCDYVISDGLKASDIVFD